MILIHSDPMQFGLNQFGRESLPNRNREVLGRRNLRSEFRDLFIQKPVVHRVQHFAMHRLFELRQIDYKTRPWIDLALYSNFEHVIVPVPMRIGTLPEQSTILLRRELRIVVVMRSGEFSLAGEIKQRSLRFLF